MTMLLKQRRTLLVSGVLGMLMIQAMMASAATVKLGPYDKAHTTTSTVNDPVYVDWILGYATATATSDVNGSLSAAVNVYSGILPYGAVVSGPARVNAYDASASGVITQKFLVSGSGTTSVQANFTSIQGSTEDWGPYNYCYPSSSPNCVVQNYHNAALPRYSYQVNSLVVATYYPCQWTTVNPSCSLTARGSKAVNFNYSSTMSPTTTVNRTSTGAGTIVVTASLAATATAKGGWANVWVSGTLSNITLDP